MERFSGKLEEMRGDGMWKVRYDADGSHSWEREDDLAPLQDGEDQQQQQEQDQEQEQEQEQEQQAAPQPGQCSQAPVQAKVEALLTHRKIVREEGSVRCVQTGVDVAGRALVAVGFDRVIVVWAEVETSPQCCSESSSTRLPVTHGTASWHWECVSYAPIAVDLKAPLCHFAIVPQAGLLASCSQIALVSFDGLGEARGHSLAQCNCTLSGKNVYATTSTCDPPHQRVKSPAVMSELVLHRRVVSIVFTCHLVVGQICFCSAHRRE